LRWYALALATSRGWLTDTFAAPVPFLNKPMMIYLIAIGRYSSRKYGFSLTKLVTMRIDTGVCCDVIVMVSGHQASVDGRYGDTMMH